MKTFKFWTSLARLLVGTVVLGTAVAAYAQPRDAYVVYVATGGLSGTTQPGVNGTDADNVNTLGLMVGQLNAGADGVFNYQLIELTSFSQVGALQEEHPDSQIWVVAHAEIVNGHFAQTDPATGETDIYLHDVTSSIPVREAVTKAESSESKFFYCGKYGDDKTLDADDVGAAIARSNYGRYPKNVTQQGALDPAKSGGSSNNPPEGSGATIAPTVPNTGMGGYFQSTPYYYEEWFPNPYGGGVLVGHSGNTYQWVATNGNGGGNPGNTVQN